MKANPIKRYFWLTDTIYRYGPISFAEVAKRWEQSVLYDNKPLPIRTFHNHREAVEELFHIRIACDERTNRYYIEEQGELAKNGLSSWLLNAFSKSNTLAESQSLGSRIQIEDIPSAQLHLTDLLAAMRENRCVKISYQPFVAEAPFELVLQPLLVKLYDRRWYLYASKPSDPQIKLYALDRMHTVAITEETFDMPEDFDPEAYTRNAFGVAIYDEIVPPARSYSRPWRTCSLSSYTAFASFAARDRNDQPLCRFRVFRRSYAGILSETDVLRLANRGVVARAHTNCYVLANYESSCNL